jgi:hypothetical protein
MRRKKSEEPAQQPGWITAENLCALTGYTDVHHREAAKAGYFPPPRKGLYQTKPTIQGLFRRERDLRAKSNAPFNMVRQKKMESQNRLLQRQEVMVQRQDRLLELQVAREEKTMLDACQVGNQWEGMVTAIKTKLLALPSRLGPRLMFAKDQGSMAQEIEKEIHAVLTELSHEQ